MKNNFTNILYDVTTVSITEQASCPDFIWLETKSYFNSKGELYVDMKKEILRYLLPIHATSSPVHSEKGRGTRKSLNIKQTLRGLRFKTFQGPTLQDGTPKIPRGLNPGISSVIVITKF